MKPGTFIQLPDGREATVVYHGLDGYGVQWGHIEVDVDAIMSGGHMFPGGVKDNQKWVPAAMLRDEYPGALAAGVECVGENYTVIAEPDCPDCEAVSDKGIAPRCAEHMHSGVA